VLVLATPNNKETVMEMREAIETMEAYLFAPSTARYDQPLTQHERTALAKCLAAASSVDIFLKKQGRIND
jgi:hypothetical protein